MGVSTLHWTTLHYTTLDWTEADDSSEKAGSHLLAALLYSFTVTVLLKQYYLNLSCKRLVVMETNLLRIFKLLTATHQGIDVYTFLAPSDTYSLLIRLGALVIILIQPLFSLMILVVLFCLCDSYGFGDNLGS